MKRLATLTLCLMLPLLAAAPAAQSAPAPDTSARTDATPRTSARATYPTSFKCDDEGNICVRLTGRRSTKFSPVFSSGVQNRTNDRITGNCTSRVEKTKSWTLGTSLSAELKAGIFAKVNATISGSISRSMSTSFSVSADFPVPPHTTRACDYGYAIFRWKAQRFDRIRSSVSNFTVSAPRRVIWRIEDVG
jgi:hypothetical protein